MTRLGLLISTLFAALGLTAVGADSATLAEPSIVVATGTNLFVRDADGPSDR